VESQDQEKNPFVEVIEKRMLKLGIRTQKALSEITGVSQATINRLFKGRGASIDNTYKILNALDLIDVSGVDQEQIAIPDLPDGRPIPVISWVMAGKFAEAVDCWPEGVSGEDEPVFSRRQLSARAFALRVVGESMETRYKEGDIIVVEPEIEVVTGDPCVAKVAGEVTFKIYYENGTEIRLKALNPKYPDMVFPKDGAVDFCVVGKVVELIPKI
jgi:SOS-response transcriptional repressor LexA